LLAGVPRVLSRFVAIRHISRQRAICRPAVRSAVRNRTTGEARVTRLAEVSWDAKQSAYRFRSHLATGDESDFAGKVVDGAFVWGFETPRGMMRYTITLDAQGRWSESGERSADGQTWQPFFAMTLDRIK